MTLPRARKKTADKPAPPEKTLEQKMREYRTKQELDRAYGRTGSASRPATAHADPLASLQVGRAWREGNAAAKAAQEKTLPVSVSPPPASLANVERDRARGAPVPEEETCEAPELAATLDALKKQGKRK